MDILIGSIPTLVLLVTILANYFDLRAKKIGFETALLSFKHQTDSYSSAPQPSTIQGDEDGSDRILTPDDFWQWAKRRNEESRKDGK